jgi:hypothetical protein
MTEQLNPKWEVVKVGKFTGWSIHSKHDALTEAEFEALRCNTFSDAKFHVRHAAQPTGL